MNSFFIIWVNLLSKSNISAYIIIGSKRRLVMYYYGYSGGYGNTNPCCYPSYGYGNGYGYGYGAAIILVLFILLVVVFGAGFINCNN
mgnify:CR=1 FL=1